MSCIKVNLTPALSDIASGLMRIGTVISASLTEIPRAVSANLQRVADSLTANATMLRSNIGVSAVRDLEETAVLATNVRTPLVVRAERVCTRVVKARAFSIAFSKDFS